MFKIVNYFSKKKKGEVSDMERIQPFKRQKKQSDILKEVNMKLNAFTKVAFCLTFLLIIWNWVGCAKTKPSEADAKRVFEYWVKEPLEKKLLKISKFQKINAKDIVIEGAHAYEIECEVVVEFLENVAAYYTDGWASTYSEKLTWSPFKEVMPEAEYAEKYKLKESFSSKGAWDNWFRSLEMGSYALRHHKVGEKITRKVFIVFEKTEKGWKGPDEKIY
jgi:hypothetical protein